MNPDAPVTSTGLRSAEETGIRFPYPFLASWSPTAMVAPTLAPTPTAMICHWAWVGYTLQVSFGRHVAARATTPVRPSLSSLPPGGQCPGDSVRPSEIPVRFAPFKATEWTLNTCPVRPAADTGSTG